MRKITADYTSVTSPDRPGRATNEAGILLMASILGKYLKGSAFEACLSRASSRVLTSDFWLLTPVPANEAGMLLMARYFPNYVKEFRPAGAGSTYAGRFYVNGSVCLRKRHVSGRTEEHKRSRNIIDGEGHTDLCRKPGLREGQGGISRAEHPSALPASFGRSWLCPAEGEGA